MTSASPARTDVSRRWVADALTRVRAACGGKPTPLVEFPLPAEWGIRLLFKDERVHPSGSLKHRLASSLITFGLCNGEIGPSSTLVDASSGSTAISEAYFARLLGLPFIAVIPRGTSPRKVALIEEMGGTCREVDEPGAVYQLAEELGAGPDAVYLDQFTNASLRTNWHSDNVASELFAQLARRGSDGAPVPDPDWIVVGAGTGGTSATFARYIRLRGCATQVAVVDPDGSAFIQAWRTGRSDVVGTASRIEGIGRPRVEPSFLPHLPDEVLHVPDEFSIAGMRLLADHGILAGPSSGTNLAGALRVAHRLRDTGRTGSIVSLLCDPGERYSDTYANPAWLASIGIEPTSAERELRAYLAGTGPMPTAGW